LKYKLRQYQLNDVERIRAEYRAGARAVLHVSPTGSGKTVIFSYITEQAYNKGKSILILTHRDNLLQQASNKLKENELNHGIIARGYPSLRYRIQVASVQTLVRRLNHWEHFDLIIIDEAAHTPANSWQKIINHFSNSKFYGCTATPFRLNGCGLGNCFDSMVVGPSFEYLVNEGFLSRPKYFIPQHIDLSKIKKTAGDYNKKELNTKMDKRYITGNAIEHYSKLCDKEPAMAFCVSIEHAEHVAEEFRNAGYIAKAIHSKMSYADIRKIIYDLGKKKIHVVSSCEIVGEGTDIPILKTVILLRPTQSLALNHQQNGRASRPYPEKEYSYHLDHVGNCELHGLINWPIAWELTKGKMEPKIGSVKTCPVCFAAFSSRKRKCPECGHECLAKKRRGMPDKKDGELKEINYKDLNEKIEKAKNLRQLHQIARSVGYEPGWAWLQWKRKQTKKLQAVS
jgi:superfamily II DNA or RNA helicase